MIVISASHAPREATRARRLTRLRAWATVGRVRSDRLRRVAAACIALLLIGACSDAEGDHGDAAPGAGRSGGDASADASGPDAGASGHTAGTGGSATGTNDGGVDASAGKGGRDAGASGGSAGGSGGGAGGRTAGTGGSSAGSGEGGGGAGGISGRGSIGKSCGCDLFRQGGRCAEGRPILWECFGPGPLPMLAAECTDLATAIPRYCCPEDFDPNCE